MPYVHIGVPFFMDFSNTKEEGNNLSWTCPSSRNFQTLKKKATSFPETWPSSWTSQTYGFVSPTRWYNNPEDQQL
jgi:hypothetical protein